VAIAQALVDAYPNAHSALLQRLAELAADSAAGTAARQAAALAFARLALAGSHKVADMVAALGRWLLVDQQEVQFQNWFHDFPVELVGCNFVIAPEGHGIVPSVVQSSQGLPDMEI